MSAVVETPLHFRPIYNEDLSEIILIEAHAYEFPWSKNIFRDCLRVGYHGWLLEEHGNIIGYGIMTTAVGECHILNLCIAPHRQNLGFGRILMEFLLDNARRLNSETVFLEVRPSNIHAIQLYYQLGFDQVGMRENYYPAAKGREDALIFAKTLVS